MTDIKKIAATEMIANMKNKVANATAPASTTLASRVADDKKKPSPKSKESRGIDPSLITTWVPLDNTAEMNEIINNAAKHRGVNVANMMAEMLTKAVAENIESLKADASQYVPSAKAAGIDEKLQAMTPEQLDAYIAKQQAAMLALQNKIAAIKAK